MNLIVILGLVIAWGASVGGAFLYGTNVGADGEIAGQEKISKAIEATKEAAQQGAAKAIAANQPINKTIVQRTQHEITENVVYRDCKLPPSGLQLANQALTGQPAEPAGGVVVPNPDAAKR